MISGFFLQIFYLGALGLFGYLPQGTSTIIATMVSSLVSMFSYLSYVNSFLPVYELLNVLVFTTSLLSIVFSIKVINFVWRLVRGTPLFTMGSSTDTYSESGIDRFGNSYYRESKVKHKRSYNYN